MVQWHQKKQGWDLYDLLVVPVAIAGVQRVQEGDLDTPIAYEEPDEFRPAFDAGKVLHAKLL